MEPIEIINWTVLRHPVRLRLTRSEPAHGVPVDVDQLGVYDGRCLRELVLIQ
jgi:hypothetical protein